jgi:hypothetical protein
MGDVEVVLRKWNGRPHRRTTTRLFGTAEPFGGHWKTWMELL